MSLQLWLPMTKDLTQQGLSNITATNNGATLSDSGKLGKCYSFDGSDDYINLGSSIGSYFDTSPISFAFWIKSLENGTRGVIFGSYGSSSETNYFNIEVNSGSHSDNALRFCWKGLETYSSAGMVTYNAWVHIAVVWDGTKVSFYKNGTLLNSNAISPTSIPTGNTYYIGRDGRTGGTAFYGYLNDFRFYDYALSPKEIEILSRGLIAHYPLNGGGRGGDNICTWAYSKNPKLPNPAGTTKLSVTDNGDYVRFTCTTAGTGGGRYGYPTSNSLVQGTVYTWSAEFRANRTITLTNSSALGMEGGGYLRGSTIQIGTEWKRISNTWTQTSSQALLVYPADATVVNDWIDMRNFKIEVGSKLTPWMPGVNDPSYTTMGYDNTTEYDVSGYQNNMTKAGTITYTSDTARYSISTHFINGSYLMATQNSPTYLPTDGLTVNLWVKASTWSNPISCTEAGGWNIGVSGSYLQFNCYISGGVGYKPAVSTLSGADLVDGKWHMLTGTFDRTAQQTKFYIDGVLQGTTDTGSSNPIGYSSNRLIISGEAQTTTPASSAFVGEESDVRIYATALSATQIAELYNTAVSVANNGALFGYELVEG